MIIIIDSLTNLLYTIIIRLIKYIRELIRIRGGDEDETTNLHLWTHAKAAQG